MEVAVLRGESFTLAPLGLVHSVAQSRTEPRASALSARRRPHHLPHAAPEAFEVVALLVPGQRVAASEAGPVERLQLRISHRPPGPHGANGTSNHEHNVRRMPRRSWGLMACSSSM